MFFDGGQGQDGVGRRTSQSSHQIESDIYNAADEHF